MKRFTKIMLGIAGLLVIVGLGFSIGGVAMGATVDSVDAVQGIKTHYKRVTNIFWDNDWDDDWDDDHDDHDHTASSAVSSGSGQQVYTADSVDEVEIDLRYDELILQAHDSDDIQVAVENDSAGNVKVECDSGKLEIESSKKIQNRTVTVFYPGDKEFSRMELEVDAGSIEVRDKLSVRELQVTVGAGEFINGEALITEKADIEVGTGNVEISGLTAHQVDGECGLGNMELEISGRESDYSYKLECAMGNISINGEDYSSILGNKKIKNESTSKTVELECGLGNISVEFTEE
ncbi:MAG: hypothetical protein Q4C91_09280 [Eubacteriales bacterium]|nr:hypothetical protein [Eubacteriales bacterium]